LATALAVEAVKAGRSVYFSTLADLITSLAKAERDGQLRERIRYLCRAALSVSARSRPRSIRACERSPDPRRRPGA
jgi:hypothetical protein